MPRSALEPDMYEHRLEPNLGPLMAYAMVQASRVAVITIGTFAPLRHDLVLHYVKEMHQGMAGWVDAGEINLSRDATRSWIDAQHARLGRPAGSPVRPGYYLFLDGQVWAYHSGLIDFKHDLAWVGVGIVAGIAALHWQSTFLFDQAFHAARFQASARVIDAFEAVMAERHSTQHARHLIRRPRRRLLRRRRGSTSSISRSTCWGSRRRRRRTK